MSHMHNTKARRQPKKWICPLYGTPVYLMIGWPHAEASQVMREKFGFQHDDSHRAGVAAQCSNTGSIIVWTGPKQHVAHVVHELLHAANMILKEAGVKVSRDNDEAQAYLLEALTKAAL